jgi:hypothetical protein
MNKTISLKAVQGLFEHIYVPTDNDVQYEVAQTFMGKVLVDPYTATPRTISNYLEKSDIPDLENYKGYGLDPRLFVFIIRNTLENRAFGLSSYFDDLDHQFKKAFVLQTRQKHQNIVGKYKEKFPVEEWAFQSVRAGLLARMFKKASIDVHHPVVFDTHFWGEHEQQQKLVFEAYQHTQRLKR